LDTTFFVSERSGNAYTVSGPFSFCSSRDAEELEIARANDGDFSAMFWDMKANNASKSIIIANPKPREAA
jgi:hypothetical protein